MTGESTAGARATRSRPSELLPGVPDTVKPRGRVESSQKLRPPSAPALPTTGESAARRAEEAEGMQVSLNGGQCAATAEKRAAECNGDEGRADVAGGSGVKVGVDACGNKRAKTEPRSARRHSHVLAKAEVDVSNVITSRTRGCAGTQAPGGERAADGSRDNGALKQQDMEDNRGAQPNGEASRQRVDNDATEVELGAKHKVTCAAGGEIGAGKRDAVGVREGEEELPGQPGAGSEKNGRGEGTEQVVRGNAETRDVETDSSSGGGGSPPRFPRSPSVEVIGEKVLSRNRQIHSSSRVAALKAAEERLEEQRLMGLKADGRDWEQDTRRGHVPRRWNDRREEETGLGQTGGGHLPAAGPADHRSLRELDEMFAFRSDRPEDDRGTGGSGGAQQKWWPPESDDPRGAGRQQVGSENGRIGNNGIRSAAMDEPAACQQRWADLLAEAQKRIHVLERRLLSEEDRSRSLQVELEQLAGELHNEQLYSARLRQRLNHQRQALEEERCGRRALPHRQLEPDSSALELRPGHPNWIHPSELIRIQPSDPRDYSYSRPSPQLLGPPFPRNSSPVGVRHAILEEDVANFRSSTEAGRHHRRQSPAVGPSGVYPAEYIPRVVNGRTGAMAYSTIDDPLLPGRGNGNSYPARPGSTAGVLMSRGMLERAERYGSPMDARDRGRYWDNMSLM